MNHPAWDLKPGRQLPDHTSLMFVFRTPYVSPPFLQI